MMVRIARAALFTVFPAELLLMICLVSGMALPGYVVWTAETVVMLVLALEAAAAYRLFRANRKGGADRRAALRLTYHGLVPTKVRKIMEFEAKATISVFLWIARRRVGVPPGATAASYAREQVTTLVLIIFVTVIETVGLDLLLVAFGVPDAVRVPVLVVDLYGIVFGVAFGAACVTRPHVVSAEELRVRYGAYLDVRVPRDLIASVRPTRGYNERSMVSIVGDVLTAAVSSQVNLVVELNAPVTVERPLGGSADVTTLRFFADDPRLVLNALTTSPYASAA
ncbi:membrane protein implicated in regulation of membrane protease activity [Sphaerisporangium krabiense]|uniref:Membrane protein implicated in regulation of membrane protease activity n=2 Tax=Sphaerisporangium krabiense TaxID=763782 RepID=A0A7W8Z6J4_9ACTN|nr:hypothetical protein [Sphaerisporangium krabiense]MBB5628394.1 membrane protein implicated in regulation of membrane protease activity [Sphaerisporangium krabiense]